MSLTEAQKRGIASVTVDGKRIPATCGNCGRPTIIHIDGRGRAWWMCGDCLARRLTEAEEQHD